jgi:hypothetical protein
MKRAQEESQMPSESWITLKLEGLYREIWELRATHDDDIYCFKRRSSIWGRWIRIISIYRERGIRIACCCVVEDVT